MGSRSCGRVGRRRRGGREMTKTPLHIKAEQVCDLLAARHSKDIFVPECKTGPSMGHKHLRLDAWAMKRSWTNPITYGYEIKVSRSDFVTDDKWNEYLEFCSEFYFVCPLGLIAPDELPPEVGLLYVSKTGSRLFNKKKAQRRDVTIPEEIFRYILMARVRVTRKWQLEVDSHKRAYWEEWLSDRKIDYEFGRNVSRGIRETIEHRIDDVDRENQRLKKEMGKYDVVKCILREFGIESVYDIRSAVENRCRDLRDTVPCDLVESIRATTCKLEKLQTELGKLEPDANART